MKLHEDASLKPVGKTILQKKIGKKKRNIFTLLTPSHEKAVERAL